MFVRLEDVGLDLGDRVLFDHVTAQLSDQDRVGLIGPNGTGKTTLLGLLAGEVVPDRGRVIRSQGLRIGYLYQDPPLPPDRTVWEAARTAGSGEIPRLEARLRDLEGRMQADPEAMADYARALDRYEMLGGYDWEARVREHLAGVGLGGAETFERPVTTLSGGERVRLSLACLLLESPDLLLLDEPTNHLDLGAIAWLEHALSRYRGSVLAVSHDRSFLRSATQAIWAFSPIGFFAFPGGYDAYREELARRVAAIEEQATAARAERERLEAFVRKWSAGTKSRQAKDRQRKLDRIEVPPSVTDRPDMRLRFEAARDHARVKGLMTRDLAVRFDGTPIWEGVTLSYPEGSRIGIVGPNGSGKSTLLQVLAGEREPHTGEVFWAEGTRIGVLHQQVLVDGETVLDAVMRLSDVTIPDARRLLAAALFTPEQVGTRVEALSGGERTRLALAVLSWDAPDALLLDEPTNHLDIDAQEALETALAAFHGTLVVVSHDRAFLQATTDTWLAVGQGRVRPLRRLEEAWTEPAPAALSAPAVAAATRPAAVPTARAARAPGRSGRLDRQALRRLEEEIATLEKRRETLEAEFQTGYRPEHADLQREYQELLATLDQRYEAWADLSDVDPGTSAQP